MAGDGVVMRSFNVFVKPMVGRRFRILVHPTDTVDEIKDMIEERTADEDHEQGISPDVQRLFFGRSRCPLRGGWTVGQVGLNPGSTIRLRWSADQGEYDANAD